MDRKYPCYASAAFGMEGLVSRELKSLGITDAAAENGSVRFSADGSRIFLCNLSMHFSDRIFVILAEEECRSFEKLFDLVFAVDWPFFFEGSESIDVSCKCTRSTLMSPRDCQSVTKKALLERLKARTGQKLFAENGPDFPVHVAVHSDVVRLLLDTSGSSLSRRGYRTWNGEAPLRETLAAALVEFSPWRPGMPLYDPCCGTGTIPIEAALRQGHIAPGLRRRFTMEEFRFFPAEEARRLKDELEAARDPDRIVKIAGSDIDPEAVELAGRHLRQAGLEGRIPFSVLPLQEVNLEEENGVFLCNPPYGERLGDQKACRELYRDLGALQKRHPTWSLCAISSDPAFEKAFGRRADKKRRLYNGRLECQFYTFTGRRIKA